ncbi:MAG: hypothetical protein HY918_01925 [Candidatus Doudnabacteria bacterium]|nr:hypothetical protein [Candidatus Doudnabacteria bacterium]
MTTYMLIDTCGNDRNTLKEGEPTMGKTYWCNASISSTSVANIQEMLYRLMFGHPRGSCLGSQTLLSKDQERDQDRTQGVGCFSQITLFQPK